VEDAGHDVGVSFAAVCYWIDIVRLITLCCTVFIFEDGGRGNVSLLWQSLLGLCTRCCNEVGIVPLELIEDWVGGLSRCGVIVLLVRSCAALLVLKGSNGK
jgi:hypothetical protein